VNSKEYFARMFSYDHWANRECLSALRAAGAANPKVLRLVAHTVSAQKLWLERILRQPQSTPVWPSSTVEECAAAVDSMGAAWREYLDRLPTEGVDEKIEYCNSKDEAWSSRVEDVLTHVLLHSAYHRGQVAREMRVAGLEPAYTDFIHAVRKGFVDGEMQ
jgi:uncharacterized damage-inducible protein DinB